MMDPICQCPEKHAVQCAISEEASRRTCEAVLCVYFGKKREEADTTEGLTQSLEQSLEHRPLFCILFVKIPLN